MGGLTAIDTATEALAYYPQHVERFLQRYETLVGVYGQDVVDALWDKREKAIVDEYLQHGRAFRDERRLAAEEGRLADTKRLIESWGGVLLVYRRDLQSAPSYRLNHEEVAKAIEEGIHILAGHSPQGVVVDDDGHACGLNVAKADGEPFCLAARTILVAAGTKPNVVLARETDVVRVSEDGFFRVCDSDGKDVIVDKLAKPRSVQVLTSVDAAGRGISFFGDLHPSYSGNVVRAMASAKQGYPEITHLLHSRRQSHASVEGLRALQRRLNGLWRARLLRVERLAPKIVELIVKAPSAAQHFHPGQFFRLQNYEALAPMRRDTKLAMEGLALTGAWVDAEAGVLSLVVLEMGGSSDLCHLLRPNEPIILMGPTGAATDIPKNETVLLVGGGLGNAVLFSIAAALRRNGSKVLYFAGYRKRHDRYKVSFIEDAAHQVVWCCDEAPGFTPTRDGDAAFVGNIVEAMVAYGQGRLQQKPQKQKDERIALEDVDRLIVIGSDAMMAAVAAARHGVLKPFLNPRHYGIGSINSPMQCMMKEICAQCLQVHKDPKTGEERVVYSCFNQDQPLDLVDFDNLQGRLSQNSVHEKLTSLWIRHCLT